MSTNPLHLQSLTRLFHTLNSEGKVVETGSSELVMHPKKLEQQIHFRVALVLKQPQLDNAP